MPGMEDRAGRAKPNTSHIALGMCRMWMLLAQIIYGKYLCEEDAVVVVVVVRQEREIGWGKGFAPPACTRSSSHQKFGPGGLTSVC